MLIEGASVVSRRLIRCTCGYAVHVPETSERALPRLVSSRLVLPAQPRVREKQVVLSAGIAVREVERHAAAAPEELLPAALQPEIGDKQRHAAGEE